MFGASVWPEIYKTRQDNKIRFKEPFALFLLSSDAVVDRVRAELAGEHMELITTNLSLDDEEALAEMFSD